MACEAKDAGSNAGVRLPTADHAVSRLVSACGIVLAGQRMSRVEGRSTLARSVFGRQLRQQLEHELLAEAELPRVLLRARSGLKGAGMQRSFRQCTGGQSGRERLARRV